MNVLASSSHDIVSNIDLYLVEIFHYKNCYSCEIQYNDTMLPFKAK
jgi:hypothetical protein